MKYFFYSTLIFLHLSNVLAQEKGLPIIRNYLPQEYNYSPQIFSALQDNRGFMYFGVTDYGVLEFDGVTWRGIPNLKKTEVYSLVKDNDGRIYVTTIDDFGYLRSNNIGKTIYTSLLNLLSDSTLKIGSVWNANLVGNDIYFFTEKCLFRYSKATNTIKTIKPEAGCSFYVPFVFNNEYYVLHSLKGIVRVKDESLIPIPESKFFIENRFLSALPFDSSRVLISTRTKGLYLLDLYGKSKNSLIPFEVPSHFIQGNNIYTAEKVGGNYLLCSMGKGALMINSKGEPLEWYSEKKLLQNDLILGISIDYSKNIWLTLSQGVSKIEQSLDISYWDKKNGLKGNIYDITRFNKTLYIATNQHIYYLLPQTISSEQDESKSSELFIVKDLPTGQNWELAHFKIPNGENHSKKGNEQVNEILLAGTQTGIYQIQGDVARQVYKGNLHAFHIFQSKKNPNRIFSTDGFTDFISLLYENGRWINEGKWEGINEDIRSIIEDSNGDLWLGTFTNGILRISINSNSIVKPKQIKYYKQADGLPGLKDCRPFYYNGKVVFGTEKGVYTYNPLGDRFEPFCEFGVLFCNGQMKINNFIQSPNGNIYIGSTSTKDGGIGYLVPSAKGKFSWNYKPFRRLPDMASISAIHVDDNGTVWIGSNEGLFKYDPSKDIKNYDVGYSCFIRKVIVGKDSIISLGGVNNGVRIENVDYRFNSIRFDFAAPFFDKEENTRYSYKLDGFDDSWSDWSTTTYKEYTRVKEGSYIFRVKALNIFDKVSSTATFEITILPPWYRTVWAYIIYSLIIIGLFFYSMRFYSRILIYQKFKLERAVFARTKEIRRQKEEIQSQAEEMAAQSEELREKSEILKRTNEELGKLSIVARETDNAVMIMDNTGHLLWVNDGLTRLYGYTKEEFYSSQLTDIYEPSSATEVWGAIQECIDTKRSVEYESTAKTKFGNIIYIQTTITPILNSEGEIEKLVAIDSNITKLKEAEYEIIQKNEEITSQKEEIENHRNHLEKIVYERTTQLEIAKNKAQESDRLKSAFLANMSHEIRTPMNAIIGFSTLLKDQDINETEKEEIINSIINNGNTLLQLIDDIIDLAKIEAGQMTVNKRLCNINKLLTDLRTNYLQKKITITDADVDLRLSLGVDSPSFDIYTDPFRTQQVITNLVENALKFTEKGYVEFGYIVDDNLPKPIIKFYVKDTGIGLTEEEQKLIFVRFTKIENNKTKLYRGAGLGLTICNNIAKLLEGEISIESKKDHGSTFFFTIPIEENIGQEERIKSAQMNYKEYNWTGKTLLVAEDENSNFRLIEVLLKKTNVKILRAINGEEAIELVINNHINLILMDIKMPVMDGLNATREIKKLNKDIPIIAQTAYAMESDENICLEAGCNGYISKPIIQDKLFTMLNKYLS
ncbi:MAG: response regulator [Bacteroidales bacterium]|nr:response regulator [Bacteroidales bacterium]